MTEVSSRADRCFYPAMALVLLVLAAAGFAPTFYARPDALPPLAQIVLAHGAFGTAWLALFALQTVLVAIGRMQWHRRVGVLGAVLAGGFVASGAPLIARFESLHGSESAEVLAAHLFTNVVPLVAFAVLVAAGVWQRAVPARHKRFMLLAAVVLAPPSIGRLFAELDLSRFNLLAYSSLACANVVYDWVARGRPHPVALIGAASLVAIDVVTSLWLAAVGF